MLSFRTAVLSRYMGQKLHSPNGFSAASRRGLQSSTGCARSQSSQPSMPQPAQFPKGALKALLHRCCTTCSSGPCGLGPGWQSLRWPTRWTCRSACCPASPLVWALGGGQACQTPHLVLKVFDHGQEQVQSEDEPGCLFPGCELVPPGASSCQASGHRDNGHPGLSRSLDVSIPVGWLELLQRQ